MSFETDHGVVGMRLRLRGAGLPPGPAGAENQHQHPQTLHVAESFGPSRIEVAP